MNKPTAVHRDSLKPRYEYEVSADENAPMLNAVCSVCGKRRYEPLGPKDGHVGISPCTPCENMAIQRARDRKARDEVKAATLDRARRARRIATRAHPAPKR